MQAATAGAMRNLSVSDDNKHSIADMEGLEVLIRAAENHTDSSLVQSQVAGALRNLSLSDEVAEQPLTIALTLTLTLALTLTLSLTLTLTLTPTLTLTLTRARWRATGRWIGSSAATWASARRR